MLCKFFMFVLFLLVVLLCVGGGADLDGVEEFLNESEASRAVNNTVNNTIDVAGDYVEEMASDAVDMTGKLMSAPEVSPEASQATRDGVINTLDTVGQAVLTVNAKAQALQECAAMCNFAFKDDSGHKTEHNLLCIAQCREQ